MTDLERMELALRRTLSYHQNWNVATITELLETLITNLTEMNNYHFDRKALEEARES
jgi:hypothetical protein